MTSSGKLDPLRIAALSGGLLLIQFLLVLWRPEWRTGVDLYLIWVLVVSIRRGSIAGAAVAVIGGMLVDVSSSRLPVFHELFYLVPVLASRMFKRQLLQEYNLLGAFMAAGLIAFKFVLMLAIGQLAGWGPAGLYLQQFNLPALLVLTLAVLVFWQRILAWLPPVERMARFGD